MQLGFVIDHTRCIGCHACTVACKSENDVPLGNFRTWVKYTERGEFPAVRRSFAVLRCNQCTEAPCIEICPVHALHKRTDGIVDVDPARCIGCKSCMQACPYDALYVNDSTGIAEKCHFCAHRTEQGLAPACAVICPTEAIVPGDFDDPKSTVSRLRSEGAVRVRKPEAGTSPNVYYREVDDDAVDPLRSSAAAGYMWADQASYPGADPALLRALAAEAEARTVYDVPRKPVWGGKVTAYLFTKSLAAGALLASLLVPFVTDSTPSQAGIGWAAASALFFLALTTALLVLDLRRPERFLYILRYPNWDSWLARGAWFLMGYGLAGTAWLGSAVSGYELHGAARIALAAATVALATLTAVYTAWLFAQARGRALWLRRTLALELFVHAILAGAALMLVLGPLVPLSTATTRVLRFELIVALAIHVLLLLVERAAAPRGREAEYDRACRLITHGPWAWRRWGIGVALGAVLPALLLASSAAPELAAAAGVLSLIGLYSEHDLLVRAGQAVPIS